MLIIQLADIQLIMKIEVAILFQNENKILGMIKEWTEMYASAIGIVHYRTSQIHGNSEISCKYL